MKFIELTKKCRNAGGILGTIWGIVGLSILLGTALFRIYPHVRMLSGLSFEWFHWVALISSVGFVGFFKGLRAFHQKFSPRCVARALYLKNNPTFWRGLLAPFFCIGYFHAPRKRVVSAFLLTLLMVLLVEAIGKLGQPWRGIIDAGVLFGLGWGLISIWICAIQAFSGKDFRVSPEVPEA